MPCSRGPGQRGRAGEVASSCRQHPPWTVDRGPLCSLDEGCPPASSRPESGTKRLRCSPAQSPPGRHGARAVGKVSEHGVPACLSPRSHMLAEGCPNTCRRDIRGRGKAPAPPPPPPTGRWTLLDPCSLLTSLRNRHCKCESGGRVSLIPQGLGEAGGRGPGGLCWLGASGERMTRTRCRPAGD